MPIEMAFKVYPEDVQQVLHSNRVRLVAPPGATLAQVAALAFADLDQDDLAEVCNAALSVIDDDDLQAAYRELERILTGYGWLTPVDSHAGR